VVAVHRQEKVEDGYIINIDAFNDKKVVYVADESSNFSDEIVYIVVDKLKSYSVNLTKPVLVVLEVGCLVSHLVGYDYRVQDDGGTKYGGIDTSEPLSLLIGQNPYNSNPDINEDDFIFLESSWKLSEVITNNTIDLSFSDGSYLQYYNDTKAEGIEYSLDHNTLDGFFNRTFDSTDELRLKQTWGAEADEMLVQLPTIEDLLELYEQDEFSLITNKSSDLYWSATQGESEEPNTHMALNIVSLRIQINLKTPVN